MERTSSLLPGPEPEAVGHAAVASRCGHSVQEYCVIDLYDQAGRWADSLIHEGNRDSVALDMRAIMLFLAGTTCPYFLVRHGHPSGLAEPSRADIRTTRSLAAMARLLGLHLHDHIIEAGTARFSFRDAGLL